MSSAVTTSARDLCPTGHYFTQIRFLFPLWLEPDRFRFQVDFHSVGRPDRRTGSEKVPVLRPDIAGERESHSQYRPVVRVVPLEPL